MLGRRDRVPGIAGDHPAGRRLVLQGIEIFRLAGEQADDIGALQRAARIGLAHELGEVGPEQHVEHRVRLGVGDRLGHRAGVDLAERGGLLLDELDVRLRVLEQLLEGGGGGLAVFVIGIDDGPALALRRLRRRQQHRHLHVGGGAQAEGVAVAVRPGELVGERLGGEEEHLALAGEARHRQPDMRQEGAGEQVHLLARHQVLGDADGVARIAAVVARDQLQRPPVDAAGVVDLLHRQLHALAVGIEEGGLGLVAVELADADRLGGRGGQGEGRQGEGGDGHRRARQRRAQTARIAHRSPLNFAAGQGAPARG